MRSTRGAPLHTHHQGLNLPNVQAEPAGRHGQAARNHRGHQDPEGSRRREKGRGLPCRHRQAEASLDPLAHQASVDLPFQVRVRSGPDRSTLAGGNLDLAVLLVRSSCRRTGLHIPDRNRCRSYRNRSHSRLGIDRTAAAAAAAAHCIAVVRQGLEGIVFEAVVAGLRVPRRTEGHRRIARCTP